MAVYKRRLLTIVLGRVELSLTLDLRDLWVGLFWHVEPGLRGVFICPVPCVVLCAEWEAE